MRAPKTVLFLCVHNSARSILAEFLVIYLWRDRYAAQSAGLDPGTVNPFAVRVLTELGIDASGARSKSITEFRDVKFDLVVTVCAPTEGRCPVWVQAKRAQLPYEDPSHGNGTDDQVLARFRRVRDEMRAEISAFLAAQLE